MEKIPVLLKISTLKKSLLQLANKVLFLVQWKCQIPIYNYWSVFNRGIFDNQRGIFDNQRELYSCLVLQWNKRFNSLIKT